MCVHSRLLWQRGGHGQRLPGCPQFESHIHSQFGAGYRPRIRKRQLPPPPATLLLEALSRQWAFLKTWSRLLWNRTVILACYPGDHGNLQQAAQPLMATPLSLVPPHSRFLTPHPLGAVSDAKDILEAQAALPHPLPPATLYFQTTPTKPTQDVCACVRECCELI